MDGTRCWMEVKYLCSVALPEKATDKSVRSTRTGRRFAPRTAEGGCPHMSCGGAWKQAGSTSPSLTLRAPVGMTECGVGALRGAEAPLFHGIVGILFFRVNNFFGVASLRGQPGAAVPTLHGNSRFPSTSLGAGSRPPAARSE
jgi:hypothetical protein